MAPARAMAVSTTALLSFLALKGHAASGTKAPAAYPRVEDIAKPVTRLAFGSCNDQSMEQPLWKHIIEYAPEMWLWMGDNIYADVKEFGEPRPYPFSGEKMFVEAPPAELRRRYAKQLANPEYKAFIDTTPYIGIWDDHDFGINDGHKRYTYREESQQIFLDFMNEPKDTARRTQEGIYTSYEVGADDRKIKFILIDNRYHRDPYDVDNGQFLGEAQWDWLTNELMTSTAAFNVIVSGIQVLAADRLPPAESWHRFPNQRERLLNVILSSNATGVILLSGDVHFAEINQVLCSDGKNLITEVTSSGMTHSWLQFHVPSIRHFPAFLFTVANMFLPWEYRPTHDSYYGSINWGQMTIDWEAQPNPVATIEVRGRDNQVKLSTSVASVPVFSATAAQDAHTCKPPREVARWRLFFWRAVTVATVVVFVLSLVLNGFILLWLVWFFLQKLLAALGLRRAKKVKTV